MPPVGTSTVTIVVENKTEYSIDPLKPNPNLARNAVSIKGPETILAGKYGSAGDFKARNDGSYGVLVAYVSPDPHFILVALYHHYHYTDDKDKGKPDFNNVKTAFLAADIEITIDLFNTIRDSTNFVESATHNYAGGDGKEHKLTVTGSVDQQVNANVDIKLQHTSWLPT